MNDSPMVYTQISPATDWFFRHDNPSPNGPPIVYPVAVWAVVEGKRVIGLIAADLPLERGATQALHQVPPVPGIYLHISQLTEQEQASAKSR
ncbi:hypothetical protein SAMN05216339_101421 [Nitrosomonas eutropha]|uniref:Uncharacterized protein n=1 Tax=Nitrosomonas eutropha TaxID=916 RepID=A0A1I7FD26_9PROT|nr:hypothetical protein [Nitrosomonas eutropha]SFU34006.1 hypothetical protein SAMN05216339_101421 [Nitrosomonas eutropha]